MLTEGQVQRMRDTAIASMPDTVTIHRLERVYDGGGGYNNEYVVGETYPCTIGLPMGGESDERNQTRTIVVDEHTHTIRLPAKTEVKTTDRLEGSDGNMYEVNAVLTRGEWEIARDVKVTELI
jgi:hypothetical protein